MAIIHDLPRPGAQIALCELSMLAPAARADCLTPAPLLLWSYPSDGDRDVPTNALFWFTSSQTMFNAELSGALNGKSIAWPKQTDGYAQMSLQRVHVDPGPLEPNTAYTFVLNYGGLGTMSGTYEIRFTTGAGPAQPASAARVLGYGTEASPQSFREPCAHIVASQGCPDYLADAPPRMHPFDVEDTSAIAWFVDTGLVDGNVLWPAVCGAPRVMLHRIAADQCFKLQRYHRAASSHPRRAFA